MVKFLKSNIRTYEHNGLILTSSPPIDTMLDSFPVVYDLMISWLNSQRAYTDILNISEDMRLFDRDTSPFLTALANDRDPARMAMYDAFEFAARQFTTMAGRYHSYEDTLQKIVFFQWKIQYMIDHFDAIMDDNQKQMMEVAKDTFARARQDAATYYTYQMKHSHTMAQLNYSDLLREVDLLLEKNPFNKPR